MKTVPLRIAINAQIDPRGVYGGVQSVLKDLVYALGNLDEGAEEYIIICNWNDTGWLKPFVGPNQRIVTGPQPSYLSKWEFYASDRIKTVVRRIYSIAYNTWLRLTPAPMKPRMWPEIPISNGFYESLGCDVIHFPFQNFVLCAIPTIFNPHDLQHLHFPQYFSPRTIALRETIYPAGCHFAQIVVAGANWVKQDIIRNYKIDADKIQVIPWAPPNQIFTNPSDELKKAVLSKYSLEPPFALYPAMTWEHKNHLRLLEAIACLKDREGMVIRLVCTGARYPGFWPKIEQKIRDLNLQSQVQFLDMVPEDHLRAIYNLSQFVIVPTLFEAASGPVFEAWQEGIPVAASTVTSLPDQVRDAGLLFDPYSVEAISDAIKIMSSDEDLRKELVIKGYQRLSDFSWEKTAKAYRAVYRKASNRTLTDEDLWLLSKDWMQY